ncbi:glycosyltransferase family 4 protein [Sporomusa acidovorans]|nr:glycosyltransferase family 4 protein [Sporomusa acidovorans]
MSDLWAKKQSEKGRCYMIANTVKKIAFLSTYPPRECGLATFTEDLVNELDKISSLQVSIIAVAKDEKYVDSRVKYTLDQEDRSSYAKAAQWANQHVELLVIEHEYGIFGGDCGDYILDLAQELKIPFIVTTHTVLLAPSSKQKNVLQELGRLSSKVVTMAKSSMPILTETYGIRTEKLVFIPHGVPNIKVNSREQLKLSYPDLQNKQVISSFGLISPAKGLEYGIRALAKVVPDFKNVIYLILGKTHPNVKKLMGESYRQSLIKLAAQLGVSKHVRFVDKYLTKEEVITYLQLSDIYLTPYLSAEQAVSGTLAYAMGYGRVIISTPYRYAQEMLGEGRGLLAQCKDADSLAACIRTVLNDPVRKKKMEQRTMAVGRTMMWENVANQYMELCLPAINRMNSQLYKNKRTSLPSMDNYVAFPFDLDPHKGMKAKL